jgi:hypothetical protein
MCCQGPRIKAVIVCQTQFGSNARSFSLGMRLETTA